MSLDQAALEALFVRLERRLFNVAYRWVWDREEAADIVQTAFVRLWSMRARVEPSTVEPLLYRITINLAKNRRRWQRLRSFFRWEDHDQPQHAEAERALLDAERSQAVRAAIEALPDKQRQVLVLCHFSGLSYREVSEITGIPEGTVGSRRNTALRLLREQLGGDDVGR